MTDGTTTTDTTATTETILQFPSSTSFPLKILRLYLDPNVSITKTTPLFSYSTANNSQIKVYESLISGEFVQYFIKEQQIISDSASPLLSIREPCTHAVQFAGQCAICGKDLSGIDYTGFSDTSRANVQMAHDYGQLTVSREEAQRLETQTTTRLLSDRKLSLIVDLDQTIVHATVDPTVGDWLDSPTNPNFTASEGTQKFRLGGAEGELDDPCWYYVKPRPGLTEFLKAVAEMYEMHVYTMGTRAYASEVCKVIDPKGDLFRGRILSRDESGSMTRKSLQRLFPCDTSMVVIIDDRADVWDGSPNLVKVIPYEFFVGIGDINAAFLPKRRELAPPTPVVSPSTSTESTLPAAIVADINVDPEADLQVVDTAASTSTHELSDVTIVPSLSDATASTALTLHDQIENRPLSHNKIHHPHTHHPYASDPASNTKEESITVESGEGSDDPFIDLEAGVLSGDEVEESDEEEGEAVLRNDDRELERVFAILKDVHRDFFDRVDPTTADVKDIIPGMKYAVLQGVNLLFSGIMALDTKPEDSEFWKMARTFGATCLTEPSPRLTHVIATQMGTAKVNAAQRIPGTFILLAQWLFDVAATWCRQPETEYLLENEADPPKLLRFPPNTTTTFIANPPFDRRRRSRGEDYQVGASPSGSMEEVGEVEVGETVWDQANREMAEFLGESGDDDEDDDEDDDDSAEESDVYRKGGGGEKDRPSAKKRVRVQTDSEDEGASSTDERRSQGNGSRSSRDDKGKGKASIAIPTGSALSKRIKKSQSRKSHLKTFTSPDDVDSEDSSSAVAAVKVVSIPLSRSNTNGIAVNEGRSPPSSEMNSDEEGYLASMAADLEAGWS